MHLSVLCVGEYASEPDGIPSDDEDTADGRPTGGDDVAPLVDCDGGAGAADDSDDGEAAADDTDGDENYVTNSGSESDSSTDASSDNSKPHSTISSFHCRLS